MVQWQRICLPFQESPVRSLGQEDPLEKEMATHSSILAWRIPWTEEPGGYSPWGRKESDMTERLCPVSMGFSRQEYWSGLPFLSPGDLPDPGIKPGSPAL